MKRSHSWILLFLIFGGCNSVATDTPGVFVDNIEGTYDLAAITETNVCTASFDTVVKVAQTKQNFSIQAQTSGFDDLTGAFDDGSEHTYTLEGADKKCTGTAGNGVLISNCTASTQTCVTDATGSQTCSIVDSSCAVTYQKR